jgi:hypothetical protein
LVRQFVAFVGFQTKFPGLFRVVGFPSVVNRAERLTVVGVASQVRPQGPVSEVIAFGPAERVAGAEHVGQMLCCASFRSGRSGVERRCVFPRSAGFAAQRSGPFHGVVPVDRSGEGAGPLPQNDSPNARTIPAAAAVKAVIACRRATVIV